MHLQYSSVSIGQLSAPLLNISNEDGRTNVVRAAHPLNAPYISLTPSGMLVWVRLLHPMNALDSIISTVAGTSNDVIGVYENAPLSMTFTSPLIVISSSSEFRNRFWLISVIPGGSVIAFSPESLNAYRLSDSRDSGRCML